MWRIVQLLYLMTPAFVANMAAPFVKYWRGWNSAISERWLGSHKTIVGFALGVLAAILTTFGQSLFGWRGGLLRYDDWFALGLRFGIGAMAGDCVKSLIKRRVGIRPGQPWIPADQWDYLVGALLLIWTRVRLTVGDVASILAIGFVGHLVVNRIGYRLGVRDVKL